MRRFAAGATGLIGRHLVEHWLSENHEVCVIGRTLEHIHEQFENRVTAYTWEQITSDTFKGAEVVVNLAGANIGDVRWTDANKKEIIDSRVNATAQLSHLLAQMENPRPALFNASAIGVYGLQDHESGLPPRLDEDTKIDFQEAPDFLSTVARQWEMATREATEQAVRVVFLRFAVVLAKEGGAFPKLVQPYRYFLGGPIGSGKQPFSWVEIDDVIRAIDFLINQSDSSGPYNIVAPQVLQQREFADILANALNKPAVVPMPKFMLGTLFGGEKANELLLEGQNVHPKRLLEAGFQFKYPTLQSALKVLL